VQTTNFWNCNYLADRLHCARIWRILIQGQRKTASAVLADIGSQNTAQSFFLPDDDVVSTFSPYRTDHAFHVRPLPRSPRRTQDFLDVQDRHWIAKCLTLDTVSIPQQELRCRFEWERFKDLARRPFGRRMRRYVAMHQSSMIMLDHEEDKQNLEECCRNREEVDGNQLFRVVGRSQPSSLKTSWVTNSFTVPAPLSLVPEKHAPAAAFSEM
jgi:hypothetical protein